VRLTECNDEERLRTMRSYMQKWMQRHSEVRQQRQFARALDEVSSRTVQDELRAIAQSQLGR
jgi:hypothetical protein